MAFVSTPDDRRDPWRKRLGPDDFPEFSDLPDFFKDFEKEFGRMRGMMQKIMEDAMKHAASPRRDQPFVYGFSMRVGPDGQPHIEPFGNTASPVTADDSAVALPEGRAPLTDIFEGDKEITLTAEIPGVEKKDIALHVGDKAVTIRVEKGRQYHKKIDLPAKVIPASAKATYKNGVLDITLQRADEKRDDGHRVSID